MTAFSYSSRQYHTAVGFTVVELLIAIVVIAILAAIGIVTYTGFTRNASVGQVKTTIADATKSLQTYQVFNKAYPSNLANTEYIAPLSVAVALYTDAAQTPVYANLSPDQNAQLFLNTCNAYMPVTDGGTTYNTSCVYNGNNLHVKGQVSSNVVIHGPSVDEADFVLTCGSSCSAAQNNIISVFKAQGGTFPIIVPKNGAQLPAPTLVTTGIANMYCVEGRSGTFSDVIYHAVPNSSGPEDGPCPTSLGLHYP